ncbi:MAG: glycosidase, partial [Marinilabilia sp.]
MITRYQHNPILTRKDVPYPVATVHNAGVTKFGDEYIMLFRSHKMNGRSILGLARSHDGLDWKVDPEPFM